MKSPFPGMDPYIEASGLWEDFHSHLIEKIGERLADVAPEHYLVRTGERSYVALVESEGKKSYPFLPDVALSARRRPEKGPEKGGTALAEPLGEAEPVTMRAFVQEEHRETFVEIYETTPGRAWSQASRCFHRPTSVPEQKGGNSTSVSCRACY